MPYLPVELDALNKIPHAARAAGVEQSRISDGLLFMWAHVFRTKSDKLTGVHVKGFFGQDVSEALVAFGFLVADGGGFRVKGGHDKLLGSAEARRKGGLAAKGNLKRGQKRPEAAETQPETSRAGSTTPAGPAAPAVAGDQPETSRSQPDRLPPALSPSTQHPTPKKELTSVAEDPIAAVGATHLPPEAQRELANRRLVGDRDHPHVPRLVEKPDTPPAEWLADDFWRWAQWKRHNAAKLPAEGPPKPEKLGSFWSTARAQHSTEVLQEAFLRFGDDPFWQGKTPPLPFGGFMSQWERFVPAQKAGGRRAS